MINDSIPVLYYHRIGSPDPVHLSISCRDFEKQLKFLKKNDYATLSVRELIDYLEGRRRLSGPAVCLTFDDGFIDNLLYAHPLLQKYGMKAALFVATSLIRPDDRAPAATMVDFNTAHSLARRNDLSHFLSQAELKSMVDSGVWEVLSHSHLHNQVFTSTDLTGFYPDTDNHWGIISAWGRSLENGRWPVYSRGASLVNRAWQPILKPGKPGCDADDFSLIQESEEEFAARVENDLRLSLQKIEEISPGACRAICWPWGKTTAKLENLARKVGFAAAMRTDTGANYPGMNCMQIHRFAIKKADLLRFKLGLTLRRHSIFARIYALFRN